MGEPSRQRVVEVLLDRYGQTFAEEAHIKLGDDPKPSPLYRLLCLATLLSAPMRSEAALEATQALSSAGWRTAKSMAASTWKQRVTVLNRNGYARYDESTARMLGDTADMLLERWNGDLRRLREEAERNAKAERKLLMEAKGIGEVGASIFMREIQGVWPEAAPALDAKAMGAAKALGLGSDETKVADLVPAHRLPNLAAALVRVDLQDTADEVVSEARSGPA